MADQANDPREPDLSRVLAPAATASEQAPAAAASTASSAEPAAIVIDRVETLRLRRSPKYAVFFIIGSVLGVLVAMILTFAFQGTEQNAVSGVTYTQGQVFGFLALICVIVGFTLGGVVALIFDRVLGRSARDVDVDRESISLRGDAT